MGKQIKSSVLLTSLQQVVSYFSFHLPAIQLFISTWSENYTYKNNRYIILLYMFLLLQETKRQYNIICSLQSSARFQQRLHDSQYLGAIHILRNSNEHHYYLTSTKSMICHIDPNFSSFQSLNKLPFYMRLEHLKLIYYSLMSVFSKYHFKTGTVCLFFLSWHAFTALEFDSYHFDILLLKTVKPRDHNEIKPPIEKIFRKCTPIRHYFEMSRS